MKNPLSIAITMVLLGALDAAGQERFSLSGDRVAIYNLAGDVQVLAGDGPNVVVEIARGGRDAESLAVDRRTGDGWQLLVIRYPTDRVIYRSLGRFSRTEFGVRADGTFGGRNLDPQSVSDRLKAGLGQGGGRRVRITGAGAGTEAHADLRILVPAGRTVTVHLGAGKVAASNIDGSVQVDAQSASVEASDISGFGRFDTGSGSISVRRMRADLGLHTGSGSITAHDARGGALVARTGSGSIDVQQLDVGELEIHSGSGTVTVRSTEAPAAHITTGSGSIRVEEMGSERFDLNTGSGSVRVTLTRDVRAGRIDTGSGGVNVALPHHAGAEITIETGSGSIEMDVAALSILETRRRRYLRGRLGDGNGTLRVSTGSGSVSFRSY